MEYLGLFGSVVLLIWLALRGVDIVFAALACSRPVIVTNGLAQSSCPMISDNVIHRTVAAGGFA